MMINNVNSRVCGNILHRARLACDRAQNPAAEHLEEGTRFETFSELMLAPPPAHCVYTRNVFV